MAGFTLTSINDTLKEFEVGLNEIMSNPSQALDMKTYLRLYTLVHDHVTHDKNASRKDGTAHHSALLYNWLNDFLKSHLTQLGTEMAKQDEDTLKTSYPEQLKRYEAAARYNSHIFRFLERHWILRTQDEGDKTVHTIYKLHMVRWKEDILQNESMNKVIGSDSLTDEGGGEQPVGGEEPHDKVA